MTRTKTSAQTFNPRVIHVDKEVTKLIDEISSFCKSEITTNFFNPDEQAQTELKEGFVEFTVIPTKLDDDY